MGLFSRLSTTFKAKMNSLLDRAEDPDEILDYSYEKQLEHLREVKRGLTDVVSSKKRVQIEAKKLEQEAEKLEKQARRALEQDREDLATKALERRQAINNQLEGLNDQITGLEHEQEKLAKVESRLKTKVEAFRSQKEMMKAQHSAAEAQVKIGEAMSGLSEEMTDVDMAIDRIERKTEDMQARASAIDELTASGTLEDPFDDRDDIDRELDALSAKSTVDTELERLKKEVEQ